MSKLLPLSCFLLLSVTAQAEELNQIFTRVQEMVTAKNYTKALEELSWAKKEIEKMNTSQLKTFFPDQLSGFTGDKFEANNIFGISNVERTYRKTGDAAVVKVSLTGASSGGAAAGGFGGLAALGSMAAMMGNQEGSDTFRIDGRTASLTAQPGSKGGELTVFLNGGSILKLELNNSTNTDALKSMATAMNLNDLEKYLRGTN